MDAKTQLIVLIGGASHWTLWELRQTMDLGYLARWCSCCRLTAMRAFDSRWAALAGAVAGTVWEDGFRALQPAGFLATVFKPDARLLPIRGNTRMQSDYEAALRLAVVEMFESAARSVDPPDPRSADVRTRVPDL